LKQSQSRSNKRQQEKKIIHSARFVKENFGDRHVVLSGETFLKSWTFRNNGEFEWPEDTQFIQTNGDEVGACSYLIRGPVVPGQEIDITMELIAPKLAGKYCSFFRFVHGNNDRFGQKVWCDILVKEPEVEQPIFAQAQVENIIVEEEPLNKSEVIE